MNSMYLFSNVSYTFRRSNMRLGNDCKSLVGNIVRSSEDEVAAIVGSWIIDFCMQIVMSW